jgi:hypothetical protein
MAERNDNGSNVVIRDKRICRVIFTRAGIVSIYV